MGSILALACSIALLTISALTPIATVSTGAMTPVPVTIENDAFKAPLITIAAGTTVVWKNLDADPHTITAIDGSFDSKGLAQDDSFSHRFTKPGKFPYYCKVHPFMKGVVVVKESK